MPNKRVAARRARQNGQEPVISKLQPDTRPPGLKQASHIYTSRYHGELFNTPVPPCPIPQLPMEINLRIFKLLLVDRRPIGFKTKPSDEDEDEETTIRTSIGVSFRPFAANSSWLHLAFDVFFKGNMFSFVKHAHFVAFERFLSRSVASRFRDRIQSIMIEGVDYRPLNQWYPGLEVGPILEDVLLTSSSFHPKLQRLVFDFSLWDRVIKALGESKPPNERRRWFNLLTGTGMSTDEIVEVFWDAIARVNPSPFGENVNKVRFPVDFHLEPLTIVLFGNKEVWDLVLEKIFPRLGESERIGDERRHAYEDMIR